MTHNEGMLDKRDEQALQAARLYYDTGLAQADVAARLGVSRPTVSKLLAHARESGFVTVSIHDPREHADALIGEFKQRFGLQAVRVVQTDHTDPENLLPDLGRLGAAMLEGLVEDNSVLGLSWGTTMASVAEHLRSTLRTGVRVVQLKGGHSHSERSTKDFFTITRVAKAFNAQVDLLPLPVIFDNREAKEIVVQDRHISHILDLGAHADVVAFTVGDARPQSLLMNLGYLTKEEIKRLSHEAVGDICSRFYTRMGLIADPAIDARTVGISIEQLLTRPVRLLVAGGINKAEAIRVALECGFATHLVIDKTTAELILEQM